MTSAVDIDKNYKETAKAVSAKIPDKEARKRAYVLALGALGLSKYLKTLNIDASFKYSLFKIPAFAQNIEIADLYCSGARLDVRVIFEGEKFYIPKTHKIYSAVPDVYTVVKFDKNLNTLTPLGFVLSENLKNAELAGDYDAYDISILQPFKGLNKTLKGLSINEITLSAQEHEKIKELSVAFIDSEISESEKVYYIKHVINCAVCRENLSEFSEFEMIISQVKNYPDLLQDSTLEILSGAHALNFENLENTEREEENSNILETDLTPSLFDMVKDISATAAATGAIAAAAGAMAAEAEVTATDAAAAVEIITETAADTAMEAVNSLSEGLEELVSSEHEGFESLEELSEEEPETVLEEEQEAAEVQVEPDIEEVQEPETSLEPEEETEELTTEEEIEIAEDTDLLSEASQELEITEAESETEALFEISEENEEAPQSNESEVIEAETEQLSDIEEANEIETSEAIEVFEAIAEAEEEENGNAETADLDSLSDVAVTDEIETESEAEIADLSELTDLVEETEETETSENTDSLSETVEPTELAGVTVEEPETSEEIPEISEVQENLELSQESAEAEPLQEETLEETSETDSLTLQEESETEHLESFEDENEFMIEDQSALHEELHEEISIGSAEENTGLEMEDLDDIDMLEEAHEEELQTDSPHQEEPQSSEEISVSEPLNELNEINEPGELKEPEVQIEAEEHREAASEEASFEYSGVELSDEGEEIPVETEPEAVETVSAFASEMSQLSENQELAVEEQDLQQSQDEIEIGRLEPETEMPETEIQRYQSQYDETVPQEEEIVDGLIDESEIEKQIIAPDVQGQTEEVNPDIAELLDDELLQLLSSDNAQECEDNAVQSAPQEPQEDTSIDALFENANEQSEQYDDIERGQDGVIDITTEPVSDSAKKMTKGIVAAAVVLLLAAAGGTGFYYFKLNKPQNTDAMPPDMNLPAQDSLPVDGSVPAPDQNVPEPAMSQDINKSMTNVFSDKPAAITITKISWEVAQKLAADESFKQYLQVSGKNLQMNLQNDLAYTTDTNYNPKVKVAFEVGKDNSMKRIQITESSGSEQIDNVVLQSIKETLKYINVPDIKDYNGNYNLSVIINF